MLSFKTSHIPSLALCTMYYDGIFPFVCISYNKIENNRGQKQLGNNVSSNILPYTRESKLTSMYTEQIVSDIIFFYFFAIAWKLFLPFSCQVWRWLHSVGLLCRILCGHLYSSEGNWTRVVPGQESPRCSKWHSHLHYLEQGCFMWRQLVGTFFSSSSYLAYYKVYLATGGSVGDKNINNPVLQVSQNGIWNYP